MDTKTRLKVLIFSGFFCAVVGTVLSAIAVVILRIISNGLRDGLMVASFLPGVLLYIAIVAVPFGLIVGSLGGWWIAPRVMGDTQSRYLFLQSSVLGAILGSTFPLLAIALGWGPLENLSSVLPISIGVGIVCGLLLTATMRKLARLLHFKLEY
jgi:hypothetical protein